MDKLARINSHQVLLGASVDTFTTEASELGWKPGYFPEVVETDLGNGQKMHRISLNSECATYQQDAGCIIVTVFND